MTAGLGEPAMWILRANGTDQAQALTFRILPGHIRTIGRATGVDFVIDAPLVSRVHCRLTADESGNLQVEDLGSTNGTRVNGARVAAATRLTTGDRLGVGRVELAVEHTT